jgi:hypothetical protein
MSAVFCSFSRLPESSGWYFILNLNNAINQSNDEPNKSNNQMLKPINQLMATPSKASFFGTS